MPGTSTPLPGGLTYDDTAAMFREVAGRCRLVGVDVAEHFPSLDVNGLTSLAITRLIANLLGTMSRSRS